MIIKCIKKSEYSENGRRDQAEKVDRVRSKREILEMTSGTIVVSLNRCFCVKKVDK
jgi:hypothetical protein